MKKIITSANSNIALIKYWGKRDENLFLPTKSSLSVCLSNLSTTTSIEFSDSDQLIINGKISNLDKSNKILKFLNFFREKYNVKKSFKIITKNNFPTAAGLASSASGFAALAKALNNICALSLSEKDLSILARMGSGSASRSIFKGFVLWNKGIKVDGQDSYAEQIFDNNYWPDLRILVAVVDSSKKKISSRDAMKISVETSPLYKDWIDRSEKNIFKMIEAIKNKDFQMVGTIAENDCLEMHETIRTSEPKMEYFQDITLKIINCVRDLRRNNISCYFTIDAGPNVKILCLNNDCEKIKNSIKNIDGVQDIIVCSVG